MAMNFEDIRRRAAETAAKLAANETVQVALGAAMQATQQVAAEARGLADNVRAQIDAGRPVEDDTADLKARLDALRTQPTSDE